MKDEPTPPNSGFNPPLDSGSPGGDADQGIHYTPNDATAASTTGAQLDYELLRLIGRGAYGEVWLARDKAGGYRAVKVIFRESFEHDRPYEREYDGIRKFEPVSRSYENQVQILHVGRHDEMGRFYYIMELGDDQQTGQQIDPRIYEPKTLKSELKKRGRFPVEECLRIGAALAGALENLHQHDLIHRDIKPANIIFVNGVPKLADIGLVTDRDVTVSYVGTEGYIPPEGPSSAQADVFSLGKVLYEMATGRDRMDFPELPTDLDELPDRETLLELNAIIAKACERDPRKRFRSAQKMFQALVQVQQGGTVRRDKILRRRLALAGKAAAMAALFGLMAFATFHFWNRSTIHDQNNGDRDRPLANVNPPSSAPSSQPSSSEPARISTAESDDGFQSLFNGRDLTGWTGDLRYWSVSEGTITGQNTPERSPAANTFLIWTNGVLEDFELRVSCKILSGNSGVQYRSRVLDPKTWRVGGYQVDLDAVENSYFGTLYEESGGRGIMAAKGEKVVWDSGGKKQIVGTTGETADQLRAAIKWADWNELAIIAQGDHLIHKINGHVAVDVVDGAVAQQARSGVLALQIHQQPVVKVQFKDIRLKPLGRAASPPSTAIPPSSSAWLPLDIGAACSADIISTDSHKAARPFTFFGGTLASASWLHKNGYSEAGIPDDGRVPIPDNAPPGLFQVRMPPAKNAMLVTGPKGTQPKPVTVILAAADRRRYSELAILQTTCWGNGTLRVRLGYETGAATTATLAVVDWAPRGRVAPVPPELRLTVISRCTHPQYGGPVELFAQRVPADPQRVLRSLTFEFVSARPHKTSPDLGPSRFTVALLAISALPAPETTSLRRMEATASALPGRWTNTLGMVFVPVPDAGVRFCIWELRRQDFEAFVNATAYDAGNEMHVLTANNWQKVSGHNWRDPGFAQGPTHPVVGVSGDDLEAFCRWLTDREQTAGKIGSGMKYRLPTSVEWDRAAGLGGTVPDYSWGSQWPPPASVANLAGEETRSVPVPIPGEILQGNNDGFPRTAPVGSFPPNPHGLYDLTGNVWETCQDQVNPSTRERAMRGGGWGNADAPRLKLSYRAYSYGRVADVGARVVLEGQPEAVAPAKTVVPAPSSPRSSGLVPRTTGRWTNSLGMVFVPVPAPRSLLCCIWETRVKDYAMFANETGRQWPKPAFRQDPDHPAVNVS